jgi:mannan endo-1,4-beta-mannosidase
MFLLFPPLYFTDLMNEPNAKTGTTNDDPNSGAPYVAAVQAWIEEMSAYVKSVDPNHLVTIGYEGECSVL